MPDILRALDEEHHYQQRVLRLLEKQVAALNQRQQPDYEVMHGVMRYMTNYPDRFHHPKEDLVFRKLVERDPSASTEVERLLRQHVEIIARGAELLAVIDRCRAEPEKADTYALRKSAHAYLGHLRRHMDTEMLRIFPRAQQKLRAADWADVDRQMKPILDPVFGDDVAPEFQALRAQESRTHSAGSRRSARPGWAEAAAAFEFVSALLVGATNAGSVISRHNRETVTANAALVRDLIGRQPLDHRVGLVRKSCGQNARRARETRERVRAIWSDAFKAAARPYREKRTPGAKLSDAFDKLKARVRRAPLPGKSPAK